LLYFLSEWGRRAEVYIYITKFVIAQQCPTSCYFLSLIKPSIWQETLHLLPFHLYTIAYRSANDGLGAALIVNWPETGCVILISILSCVPVSSHWASQVACSSQYKRHSFERFTGRLSIKAELKCPWQDEKSTASIAWTGDTENSPCSTRQ
jgi:hypothetical protein